MKPTIAAEPLSQCSQHRAEIERERLLRRIYAVDMRDLSTDALRKIHLALTEDVRYASEVLL